MHTIFCFFFNKNYPRCAKQGRKRHLIYDRIQIGADMNTVFLVYDEAGDEQLGLTVGTDVVLQYNDREAPEELKYKVKFNVGVDDGR